MRTSVIPGLLPIALVFSVQCAPSQRTTIAQRAAPAPPQRYLCYRATERIVIDGRLDEPTWAAAPWTRPFVDILGNAGVSPRYRTRVRMLWDDERLYIAANIQEPDVRAALTERDSIVYHDNDFEVFIDANGDARDYFEIEVNALNTVFDLFLERTYRDRGPVHHDWNLAGLETAVTIDGTLNDASDRDLGWCVEMALPWRALDEHAGTRIPPHAGDIWRMNFSRVQWPDGMRGGSPDLAGKGIENNWVWSPQGVVDMHIPQRWGYVEFSADVVGNCAESRKDRHKLRPRGLGRSP